MNENTDPATPTPDSLIPPPPPASGSAPADLPPNVLAGLAAVFPLVGGLIVYLIEKKNPFVRFTALQSVYFGVGCIVTSIGLTIVSTILAFIPVLGWIIGILLGLGLTLGLLALWLIAIIKAFSGQEWEMPVIGKMVRTQLAKSA